MKYSVRAFVCLFGAAAVMVAQSGSTKLTPGLAKVKTMDGICAETPDAPLCQARGKVAPSSRPRALARQASPARRGAASSPSLSSVKRFAVPVQLPAGDARWRFFHQRTAVAAGLNLKAWREAGMFDKVAEQLKTAGVTGGWEIARPMLEELDEAWIMLDATSRQGQPVVLLSGRFENPMWRQVLSARVPLTGATAVLVGEPLAVNTARRRLKLATPVSKLAKEAEGLSKDNDIWLAGIPSLMPKSAKGGAQAAPMVDSVKSFSLALNFRERVTGELNLQTATPAAAEQLMGMYRLVEMQAAESNPKEWEPMAKALAVSTDAANLRVKLSLDPAELTPVLAARMKASQNESGLLTATKPRSRKMIVIQGLEDGPREIPLDGRP